jgi:hypothetical protein
MKYATAGAFRAALEQQLRNRLRGDDSALARERKRIAFGRLLARLSTSRPGSWILKGGFALDLRLGDRSRSTRDVDLAWLESEAELAEALIAGATYEIADFFTLEINRTTGAVEQFGGAHRFSVSAGLAGRRFESFGLDIGPAYEQTVTPDLIELPPLPGMNDWPVVAVPILLMRSNASRTSLTTEMKSVCLSKMGRSRRH